jgi:hypothetical protein
VQGFNLQHYKQHTPNVREADEHIILNRKSTGTKAHYVCGKDNWEACTSLAQ